MPVSGTPAGSPDNCNGPVPGVSIPPVTPADPPVCSQQNVVQGSQAADPVTGVTIQNRMPVYNLRGKTNLCIEHVMRDDSGNPLDMRECLGLAINDPVIQPLPNATCPNDPPTPGPSSSSSSATPAATPSSSSLPCSTYKVRFRMGEYLTSPQLEGDAEVVDAKAGKVKICLCPEDILCPGIYHGEFALIDCTPDCPTTDPSTEHIVLVNEVRIIIVPNSTQIRTGPPTIAEVRLFLRDTSPAESHLLEGLAFSDDEIAQATILPIQYWNEVPPDVARFTTTNFPFRYHWLIAITGYLFLMAAEQNRRNQFDYSAAGVSVKDQQREPNYEAAAERRLAEWRDFVKRKKAEININNGFGGVGSPYSYGSAFNGWPYRSW